MGDTMALIRLTVSEKTRGADDEWMYGRTP